MAVNKIVFRNLDISFAKKDVNADVLLSDGDLLSKIVCKQCKNVFDLTLQKEEYFAPDSRQIKCDECHKIVFSLEYFENLVRFIQNINLIKRLYMYKKLPLKIICKKCQKPRSMRLNPFYDHLPDGTPLCRECRTKLLDIRTVIDKPQKLGVYIKVMGNTLRCSSCKSKTKLTAFRFPDMFSEDCIPICPKCKYLIFTSYLESDKNLSDHHDDDDGEEHDALDTVQVQNIIAEQKPSQRKSVALNCSRASICVSGIGVGDSKARKIEMFKRNLAKGSNCIICESCRKPVVMSKLTLRQYNSDGIPICPTCNKPVNLDDMNMVDYASTINEKSGSCYVRNTKSIIAFRKGSTIGKSGRSSGNVFGRVKSIVRQSIVRGRASSIATTVSQISAMESDRRQNYSGKEMRVSGMVGLKPLRPYDYSKNEYTFHGHNFLSPYDQMSSADMDDLLDAIVKPINIYGVSTNFEYYIPDFIFDKKDYETQHRFKLPPLQFYDRISQPLPQEPHDRRILLLIDESDGAKTAFKWYLDNIMNQERDFLILLCMAESNRYRKRNLPIDEISEALVIKSMKQKIRRLKILSHIYSTKVKSRGLESYVLLSATNDPVVLVKNILNTYRVDFTIIGQQPHAPYLAMYSSLTRNLRTFVSHPVIVIPHRMKYHAKSRARRKIEVADLKAKDYMFL